MKSEQQQDPGAADLRGMPFWAWNTGLDAERIREQIGVFAEMGFGGFVIHSRNGLRTPYLGKTYLEMVRLAVNKLSKRERRIMELRFGLAGEKEHTQKEVADMIGISQSYISRLEKRIMKRLRVELEQTV